jgi:hypothetical protein
MKCTKYSFYRKPCKNKDINENGICKKHNIMEMNASPIEKGKCIYINRNHQRCLKNAYSDGENENYCCEHSLYVLLNRKITCKCCMDLYINTQQEILDNIK